MMNNTDTTKDQDEHHIPHQGPGVFVLLYGVFVRHKWSVVVIVWEIDLQLHVPIKKTTLTQT